MRTGSYDALPSPWMVCGAHSASTNRLAICYIASLLRGVDSRQHSDPHRVPIPSSSPVPAEVEASTTPGLQAPSGAAVARRTLQQRLSDPPVLAFLPLVGEVPNDGRREERLRPFGKLFEVRTSHRRCSARAVERCAKLRMHSKLDFVQ